MKIVYLFTTFPVASETFLQRELRLMARQGIELEIHSMWKGDKEWEGHRIHHFRHRYLLKLLWALPYWAFKKPEVLRNVLQRLFQSEITCLQNLGELLVGLGFALVKAREFDQARPNLLHGVWATMPATAAWLLNQLTGLPYTMGAHAYDVFRRGGDCLLPAKVCSARIIHTTTEATRQRLICLGAKPERIRLIRRGLDCFPPCQPRQLHEGPLRFISVGRMVEKKGFDDQLRLFAKLKEAGIAFEARIIGDGVLMPRIIAMRDALGLRQEVSLPGWLGHDAVLAEYAWADAFLFTGKIARDGDRDGLPNVIPEAMASGLTVLTTPVSGTTEAIEDGVTGFVCPPRDWYCWLAAIRQIQDCPETIERIHTRARAWAEEHFDTRKNAALLAEELRAAVGFCDYPGPAAPLAFETPSVAETNWKAAG